ncbi:MULTISPECIES: hypothetical protein [unclassified Streptomyces]|uniref:hypothetical protein n=1 Tax=unclassified Streptomyces TaxID=2593676 RepID=UPI001656497D|nr:hypothetical protein [Streptomyces sp. CB02980]MCB8903124.1 hypothetical protein [Streptomyces sp. CB02980]
MTMPPPPNQPPHNPYGGPVPPPQQPGPYGAPQGFPPPGHPQQTYPQYGVPPQYPAGPGPGPGGWGGPPMGPPPKKKLSAGAIVAIVVGSLVVVGGIGYGVKAGLDGVTGPFPEATHKLVVPQTVLDGEFTLVSDLSDTQGKEIEDTPDFTVKDATAAVGQYSGKDESVLVLSGLYGQIKSPGTTRSSILKGAATDKGSKLVVKPRDFTPAGYGVTVSCQVTTSKDGLSTTTLPMCAWGDENTAAAIALVGAGEATADPKDIDLADLAEKTAKIRAEIRKPIA